MTAKLDPELAAGARRIEHDPGRQDAKKRWIGQSAPMRDCLRLLMDFFGVAVQAGARLETGTSSFGIS